MRRIFYVLLQMMLITLSAYGQEDSNLDQYIQKLYSGFPLQAEPSIIYDFCKNQIDFVASKNMYDSSKIDYRFKLAQNDFIKYKPQNIMIEYFYAYKWGVGDSTLEHSLITGLNLKYENSKSNECKGQFETIVKSLKKLTPKNSEYDIYSSAGKIGKGFDFYRDKKDKYPLITVHLNESNCLGHDNYIYIAYITLFHKRSNFRINVN